MKYLPLYYFLIINILAFLIMGIDKSKARRGAWRVKESTLFALALLGGSIGVYLAMGAFHHKTLHKKFSIGIPLIIILQAALIIYITIKTAGLI